jgi:hypothetical protein
MSETAKAEAGWAMLAKTNPTFDCIQPHINFVGAVDANIQFRGDGKVRQGQTIFDQQLQIKELSDAICT